VSLSTTLATTILLNFSFSIKIREIDSGEVMPRELFSLDAYRAEIQDLVAQRYTQPQILVHLADRHGVKPSLKTLKRRLRDWAVISLRRQKKPDDRSQVMLDRIEELIYRRGLYKNQDIVEALSAVGIHSSCSQVRNIRYQQDWLLRARTEDDLQSNFERTKQLCWEAIEDGPARGWGRGYLQTYLRVQYNWRATHDDVQEALSQINAERGIAGDRIPGLKPVRRIEALYRGPNFIWCIDGHDKLKPFGIEIYGAIDGYSRKLIWIYCGVSNHTQISVAKQFLVAVQKQNAVPRFIRADRVTEVPLLLDIQYNFYRAQHAYKEGLRISDCTVLGKSVANQRIESIWKRLVTSTLQEWRYLFREIYRRQLFRSGCPSDKVVLLFIFMPIIRREVSAWTQMHNNARIRKDPSRIHHIAGRPLEIYERHVPEGHPIPRDYGSIPDAQTLQDHLAFLATYGKSPNQIQGSCNGGVQQNLDCNS
jgi:hypothetical protein